MNRNVWWWVVLAFVFSACADLMRAEGACAKTPEAALLAVSQGASTQAPFAGQGYRVESVHHDLVLQRNWAVVRSCDHPEWPAFTLSTHLAAQHSAASLMAERASEELPVVRAGDLVRLWRTDGDAHIEMIATAEQSGAIGTRVRVRMVVPPSEEGQPDGVRYLAGVVRGPESVELRP